MTEEQELAILKKRWNKTFPIPRKGGKTFESRDQTMGLLFRKTEPDYNKRIWKQIGSVGTNVKRIAALNTLVGKLPKGWALVSVRISKSGVMIFRLWTFDDIKERRYVSGIWFAIAPMVK